MDIIELKNKQAINKNAKLSKVYSQFMALLKELRKKELPDQIVHSINKDIEELNSISDMGNELRKTINKKQAKIIKLLEKELKIVPKNYYRNIWLAVGMTAFGIPIGLIFGMTIGNYGFLAIGLPIGMAIGIAVGTGMDKKASETGRQLDVET